MVNRSDYGKREVEISLSVLIEVMTVLGEFRDQIVLVGGWIPYFLLEDKKDEHTGSLDIDIALDFRKISNESYRTILQLLKERGYLQQKQPYIFHREIEVAGAPSITVQIDLLSSEYGGTGRSHRTQKIQDVRARKARGCDLVFEHYTPVKLQGKMPDGSFNELMINVADLIPFLVMKGMAIWERYREKDAYDIYFTILFYPGGIQTLVETFEPYLENKLVEEGLGKIRSKFQDIEMGPIWVVNFLEIDDSEERERVQRDVYERVNALLDALNIEPYRD